MGKFFGSLVGTVLSRILVMAAIVTGGQYYLGQSGGIAGLLGGGGGGGDGSAGAGASPISAGLGLGAIASTLGLGGPARADHFEVQGRISAVRTECRLVNGSGGRAKRTEPLACDRARAALSYPQFADYSLQEAQMATYIYYAMDGVRVLRGKAEVRSGQRVGDVIDLRIDRADPRRSTPI